VTVVESEMRHRLVWLVSVRLAVGTLLLGTAVLLQWNVPNTFPANPFFLLIALTFALTVLWVLTLPYASRHAWLVWVQLAADTAAVSSFVFLTGGISSYFALLYALPIIGASMLLSRAAGVWMALLSTVMFGGQVLMQYLASAGHLSDVWIGPTPLLPTARFAQYTVGTDAFAFFAIAFLSGTLADGLRRADTRLKQASSAIADLKAFNQHVIDSLTSGLATTDRAGRLLTFNRAAQAITGLAAADVIGRRAAEVLQLPHDFTRLLERDLDGAPSCRFDVTHRAKDGGARELGFGVAHLVTPDGRTGFLISFQDVTEIRRLENDGRRKQRLAALGEMAAGIAHEIRNPLASLVGSIQILRSELTLEQEQAKLMDIVLRESERLNDTIRSFLAYARPQRSGVSRVEIGRTLRDTAVLLRNSPDVRDDHRIETAVEPGELWYETDENQIRQIIWNLATNGVRAMPEGGTLRIAAWIRDGRAASPRPSGALGERALPEAESRRFVLEVRDEGTGIPPEELDGIFHPFQGRFAKGSGLGLAIVQRIVADHEGEIKVESEVGKGTAIKVILPVSATPVIVESVA